MRNAFGDQVECFTLSLDFAGGDTAQAEALREDVLKVLKEHGITVNNIICSDPAADIFEKLDPLSIPVALVYDGDGQLRKRFHNDSDEFGADGFRYEEHVIPYVEKLLKEKENN